MFVTIGDTRFDFYKVDINVVESGFKNTFAKFEKMTLGEPVRKKKYEHLKIATEKLYPQLLDKAAGQVILFIKLSGDSFYKQFLNNYGDFTYSRLVVNGSDDLFYKIDWNEGATPKGIA